MLREAKGGCSLRQMGVQLEAKGGCYMRQRGVLRRLGQGQDVSTTGMQHSLRYPLTLQVADCSPPNPQPVEWTAAPHIGGDRD